MSTRQTEPRLDLETMPLNSAALMLRRIGTELLHALAQQQPLPLLDQLIDRRETALLLSYARLSHAIPLSRRTYRLWTQQLRWWLRLRQDRLWAPPDLAAGIATSIRATLKRPLPREQWQPLAAHWIDRLLDGLSPHWVAAPFWELAGSIAWQDEAFLMATASTLRRSLATRVIFEPGPPPAPLLTPQTWWMLIALSNVHSQKRTLRLENKTAGIRRLQAIGSDIALASGWAKLWDQWLITEVLRIEPGARERIPPPLQRAIAALPIQRLRGHAPVTADRAAVALAAPGWDRAVPPWFQLLIEWDQVRTSASAPIT